MKTILAAASARQQSRTASKERQALVKRKLQEPPVPRPAKSIFRWPPGAQDPMAPQPEDAPNRKIQR